MFAMVATSDRGYGNLDADYGLESNKWLGPSSVASCTGNLARGYPGNYGWDAAGLAADPAPIAACGVDVLIHARWAMLNAASTLRGWPHTMIYRSTSLRGSRGSLKRSARAVRAQCARQANIWASGRTGDPCFEIIGASSLPCCVGFDAFSTLGI